MMRALVSLLGFVLTMSFASPGEAQFPSFTHVVREGETLASIAQRYYGDPRREAVLVRENGLDAEGGVAIVVGLRLVVPSVAYHRVEGGETWGSIADHYYGTAQRAYAIMDANPAADDAARPSPAAVPRGGRRTPPPEPQRPGQPPEGAEILIPYPLRHVADQRDTVQRVAQAYFGDTAASRELRRFNGLRGTRLVRGQVILVPIADLTLSEEGRTAQAHATGSGGGGNVRELQERITAELPNLQEHVRHGRYTEAIALGHQLLGAGALTGNQVVTIERALAVAYVALDREDLAVAAFVEALSRQPDLELDGRRTSPTVLRVFELARDRTRPAAPVDAGVGDDAGQPTP